MGVHMGLAFHASIEFGQADCRIAIAGSDLVASLPAGKELRLDLRQTLLERRTEDGGMLYFSGRGEGAPVLTTKDLSLLEEIEALHLPEFERMLSARRLNARQRFIRRFVIPAGVVLGLFVVLPWLLLGPLTNLAVSSLPRSLDRKIGDACFDGVLNGVTGGHVVKVTNPAVVGPVQKIVDRLVSHVDAEGFQFEVTVIDLDMVNAFALPGGKIVVTTGLLSHAETPEEVAGVLAHEISHVTNRHCLRGIAKHVGVFALLAVVFGDVSSISGIIMNEAANLTSLSFSRGMESEADRDGVDLLARAEVDPSGLQTFLEEVEKTEGQQGRGGLAERWLGTHPVTRDRIEAIKARVARMERKDWKPFDVDWKALQDAVKKK